MTIRLTLAGPPRTKKTSNRIITIPTKGSRRCHACGTMPGFKKILPSEAYEVWFAASMRSAPRMCQLLRAAGVSLPLTGPVEVSATFYRERDSGDLLGFEQALADWLQEPKVNEQGKQTRDGAGIIRDDVQIKSWDGSRLAKDALRPRIEVEITEIEVAQMSLLEAANA